MTGLERNADVVTMASYAPLFSNSEAWQWTPDLIWADSLRTVPSVNYYVQQLYCQNRGDVVLPTANTAPVDELRPTGRVGLGTSQCAAEFKDVHLAYNGGPVLLDSTFATDAKGWSGGDTWKAGGGAYRQTDPAASAMTYAGDIDSTFAFTLTLKARRTSDSGALVVNVCDDNAHAAASRVQWILGAPVGGLTVADPSKPEMILQTHLAEQDQLLAHTPGSLETNRWYDIKIVVRAGKIECSLDGKVIQSAALPVRRVPGLFTSATRDAATGQTILKVVNPGAAPTVAQVKLQGAGSVGWTGQVTTLAGDPAAEDNFAQPGAVVRSVPDMKTFRADLRLAGIDEGNRETGFIDFHSLRKTLSTMMAMAKMSQRVRQSHMRHTDPRLTDNTYMDERLLPVAQELATVPAIPTAEVPQNMGRNDAGESVPGAPPGAPIAPELHRKTAILTLNLTLDGNPLQEEIVELVVRGPLSQVLQIQRIGQALTRNDKTPHLPARGL